MLDVPKGGFYHAGDTLSGKVLITLENAGNLNPFKSMLSNFSFIHENLEVILFLALRIILVGQAINSWQGEANGSKQLEIMEEEYLNFEAEMNIERNFPQLTWIFLIWF